MKEIEIETQNPEIVFEYFMYQNIEYPNLVALFMTTTTFENGYLSSQFLNMVEKSEYIHTTTLLNDAYSFFNKIYLDLENEDMELSNEIKKISSNLQKLILLKHNQEESLVY